VSIRPRGAATLGTRTEIKNLNSFRNVARALDHEIARQVAVVESGGEVVQETLLWDPDQGETVAMRSKEEAHDYRYFPEPDLPPLVAGAEWIEEARRSLPELPAERRQRLAGEYGLPAYDASVLTQERAVADYFEAAARASGNPKSASNWVMTEVLRKVKEGGRDVASCPVSPAALAGLVRLIDAGTISGKIAKDVFERMWATSEEAATIVEREGLTQLSDESALEAIVADVVARSPDQAASYRGGKAAALGWFVGQVMKRTGGRANPQRVNALLRESLGGEPEPSAER
jgi:aspartyl-tRNA(Asn)/glutamyl-tRNA(Gln) amidotransferase subunit B